MIEVNEYRPMLLNWQTIQNVVDLTVWIPTFGRMKFVATLKLCAPDLEPFKVQGKFLSYDSRMMYNQQNTLNGCSRMKYN